MSWMELAFSIGLAGFVGFAGYTVGILVSTGAHWRQSVRVRANGIYGNTYTVDEAGALKPVVILTAAHTGSRRTDEGFEHGLNYEELSSFGPVQLSEDKTKGYYRSTETGWKEVGFDTHTGDDSLPEQIRRRLDGGDGA